MHRSASVNDVERSHFQSAVHPLRYALVYVRRPHATEVKRVRAQPDVSCARAFAPVEKEEGKVRI